MSGHFLYIIGNRPSADIQKGSLMETSVAPPPAPLLPDTLLEYLGQILPWAHGHQLKGIATFVAAILERQTGNQAELARGSGNQEAAVKRLARLIHNVRLAPYILAEATLVQALRQLPHYGPIRISIDWTVEDDQHLLVVSLGIGGRAVPIFWRAYRQSVLKGRMHRYELAVIRRALTRLLRQVGPRRVKVTADRGFADDGLFALLQGLGVPFVIRVKGNVQIRVGQKWRKLNTFRFEGNTRRRSFGQVEYCESHPRRLWVTTSRARNKKEKWETWYLVSNRPYRAGHAANEYARRFGCEEGFRDAKRLLGFVDARIADIAAWSRMFALFAWALWVLVSLGTKLLGAHTTRALGLLRRVASRRQDRCELSLPTATLKLLQQDKSLWAFLVAVRLDLKAHLPNVS